MVLMAHGAAAQDPPQPAPGTLPNAASGGFDPGAALGLLNDASANSDPSAAPAFAGLVRELSVDPLTGAAQTSIAIELPSGRKGATPALTLSYSSNSGNGLFGVGWDLPLGCIKRSTRHGVPAYTDTDEFQLLFRGGTVVLDRVLSRGPGTVTYGSSVEEAFLRVVFSVATNQFTVTDKSGTVFTYGGALSAKETRTGGNVTTAGGTYSWALTSVLDPNGNRIDYTYMSFTSFGVEGNASHALYPGRIDYGGNAGAGYTALFHVGFEYDPSGRPDLPVSYRGGFKEQLWRRIGALSVWTGDTTPPSLSPTRYTFTYAPAPDTGWSQLVEVARIAEDGTELPHTTLTYQPPTHSFGTTATMPLSEARHFAGTGGEFIANEFTDLVDIDGDGRLDVLDVDTLGFRVARNLGTSFASFTVWPATPHIGYVRDPLGGSLALWADMTGDGRPDYIQSPQFKGVGNTEWDVQVNTGAGLAANATWPQPIWGGPLGLDPDLGQPRDIDGDGRADLLECTDNSAVGGVNPSSTNPYCTLHHNTGSGFTEAWWYVPLTPAVGDFSAQWPKLTASDAARNLFVGLFDLNGDGLPDLVSVPTQGSTWDVFLNTGRGFDSVATVWSAPLRANTTVPAPLQVVQGNDPVSVIAALRDMNGDGLPDYVDAGTSPWTVFINTGSGFAAGVPWSANPAGGYISRTAGTATYADLRDFDGDGVADFITSVNSSTLSVVDGASQRPGVLVTVQNGLGATMSATYGAATATAEPKTCTAGANAGRLCQVDSDCLGSTCLDCGGVPFPLWTVQSITTDSGFSGAGNTLTRTYTYASSYFDPDDREFRGFRFSEETHPAGRRTLTQFWQPDDPRNPADRATARLLKGKPKRRMVRGTTSAQPVFSDTFFDWDAPALAGDRNTVRLTLRVDTTFGANSGDTQQVTTRWLQFDDVNNPLQNSRDGTGAARVWTVASYERYVNSGDTIRDRPASLAQYADSGNAPGAKLSEKQFDYDTRGNVTAIRDWLDTTNQYVNTATLAYDNSAASQTGQPASITDALNHPTQIDYSGNQGFFPWRITNALLHQTTLVYDLFWGKLTSRTDPNAQTTSIHYDALGRPMSAVRPLDDATPSRLFDYTFGSAGVPSRVDTFVREPSAAGGLREMSSFIDSLGRPLESKHDDVVNGASVAVVIDAVTFDTVGRVASRAAAFVASQPTETYEVAPASAGFTTTTYDALDRVTKTTNTDGTHRDANYDVVDQTTTFDENYWGCTADPCKGAQRVERRDALGRITDLRLYEARANSTPALKARTVTEYDPLNRVIRTTTHQTETTSGTNNTTVTFTYDSLGRRLTVTDPDSGASSYGYDLTGNLIYQDDPKPNQHLQYCYDALNRVTRKQYYPNDDYVAGQCTHDTSRQILYYYDVCSDNSIGRVCEIDEFIASARSGMTRFEYDGRGRVTISSKSIWANGLHANVDSFNVYDVADHLTSMTYPTDTSTEVLTYYYDAAGRVVTASTPGQSYLVNTQYDRFGRVVQQSEAASISQNWVYGGASTQFRLQEIRVQHGAAVMQDFQYGPYDPNGNLRTVTDNNAAASYPYANATARDNDWSYTYDGVGRLATMQNPAWASAASPFGYDMQGNLTTRGDGTSGGLLLTPDTSKPHQVKSSSLPGPTPVYQYDDNGSLSSRPDTDGSGVDAAQQVTYDMDGRVATVTVGTTIVSYLYDYTGARVARTVQQGTTVGLPTFYFGNLIDYDRATQTLTRHIYASGRRIAQSSVTGNLILAQADSGGRLIMLARTLDEVMRGDGPTMNPLYPHYALAAEDAAKLAVLLLLTLLVLDRVPGRVRVGMRVGLFRRIRRGHVIVFIVIFGLSLTPLTCARPSHAGGGGGGGGGGPPPPPSFPVYFVHSDHLGSTTLLTCYKRPTAENCADGTPAQYFRYDAYGMTKAFTSTGTAVTAGSELTDHLYTGQRWEYRTRLYDYVARTYDPRIARFLTHDPVREYMNPYAYVAWNPAMRTDPTGMIFGLGGELAGINYVMGIGDPNNSKWDWRAEIRAGLWAGSGLRGDTSIPDWIPEWYAPVWLFSALFRQGSAGSALQTVTAMFAAGLASNLAGAKSAFESELRGTAERQGGGVMTAAYPIPNASTVHDAALPGYVDFNATSKLGSVYGIPLGLTGGAQVGASGIYAYVGAGIATSGEASTFSTDAPSPGFAVGFQATAAPPGATGPSMQIGYSFGYGVFTEWGIGAPYGFSVTAYYVFGPIP
jgi:RHS repeat-associated protein